MRLSGSVFSQILDMDTGITVVTPNKIKDDGDYNVVYLLHGICGDSKTWLDYSMLPVFAAYSNTIYILPEVQRSFYSDMSYGLNYFTYITDELPKICKSFFNISAKRVNTAVIGCSMGGYGALKCAYSKPEMYGMCGAFSSCCLFLKEGLEQVRQNGMNKEFVESFGEHLIADLAAVHGKSYVWKPENDILELIKKASKTAKHMPKLYLTCGTEDVFYNDHIQFCKKLNELNIEYTFEEWKAWHEFNYFNDALKKAVAKFNL